MIGHLAGISNCIEGVGVALLGPIENGAQSAVVGILELREFPNEGRLDRLVNRGQKRSLSNLVSSGLANLGRRKDLT